MLNNLMNALHLNGYGAYVWSAYGLSLAALALETLWSRSAMRRQRRQLHLQTTHQQTP
jgi:heme exporter protein CcmD